jgi:hypothetical protein
MFPAEQELNFYNFCVIYNNKRNKLPSTQLDMTLLIVLMKIYFFVQFSYAT